jgi:hypothetical protein
MATERYDPRKHLWCDLDLAENAIPEECIGWGDATLYYPAVSSCTAIVIGLDNDTLLGAHLLCFLTSNDVDAILDHMLGKMVGRTAGHLLVFGSLNYKGISPTSFGAAPKFQGTQQIVTFAKKFNVKGFACFYDQGDDANKHYRAQTHPGANWAISLSYSDVTYNVKAGPQGKTTKDPIRFNKGQVTWTNQSISPLRELY